MSLVEVFGRAGVTVTMAQAREPMGIHKRDHIAAVCAMPAVAAGWRAAHGREPTDQDVERLYQEAIPLQIECLPRYAEPISGALEVVDTLRDRGVRIGSTTGYIRSMLDVLMAASARLGYRPDVAVSADEVPAGRPAPFMCFEALGRLGVWPVQACVKVGDTVPDIAAGLAAGMWTVGVAMTGNAVGLTPTELGQLSFSERRARRERARKILQAAGAHIVIDSIADLMGAFDVIERRTRRSLAP